MANVKRIEIEGALPFNILQPDAPDPESDRVLRLWFALMSTPTWGFRIEYGSPHYVPNQYGGKTAYYPFSLSGEEAVNWNGLEEALIAMRKAGTEFTKALVWDEGDDFRAASDYLPTLMSKPVRRR